MYFMPVDIVWSPSRAAFLSRKMSQLGSGYKSLSLRIVKTRSLYFWIKDYIVCNYYVLHTYTTITMILLLCREIASVGKKIGLIFFLRSWDQDTWIQAISFPIFEFPNSFFHGNLKLKEFKWFFSQSDFSKYISYTSLHATNIMNEWATFFPHKWKKLPNLKIILQLKPYMYLLHTFW